MHPVQAWIDGMNQAEQKHRAETQMTLGELIEALEALPDEAQVSSLGLPRSYRGYYCDLAFEPPIGTMPAKAVAALCRSAMGAVFEGYKGGEYMMGARTPVWVAAWGDCGERIVALRDGQIVTVPDDD